MCRSSTQRQRSITIASDEDLTLDFLTTNTTGMILIPNTTTTFQPDHEHDGEEQVDAKDDEQERRRSLLKATSSMMLSPRVSPPLDDTVMILSHEEEDDDHDHEALVVTTPSKKIINKTGDASCHSAVPVTGTGSHHVANDHVQQQKNKIMKRVSIDERVQVRTTLARTEISPHERMAAWYSQEEFQEITESCCKQLKKLNRGEVLKDKKYCARGLEAYTHTRSKIRKLNRLLAFEALWVEEERQELSGIYNEEALARVYRAVSSSCQLWAQAVALQDQKEADNIAHSF